MFEKRKNFEIRIVLVTLMRCISHLMMTSARSTASLRCLMVALGVKPRRWIELIMCSIRWCRTGKYTCKHGYL